MEEKIGKRKESNFISAVVYVKNAESRIKKFLTTVNGIFSANFLHYEIVCVNDCSTDNSVDTIKEFSESMKEGPIISILNMGVEQGQELSMDAGIDLTIGDFVFEFDSTTIDFKESLIMDVYFKALTGYDIVSACPQKGQQLSSKLFYAVFNRYSNTPYDLCTERFRIISRRGINRIYALNKTIPYRKAVYAQCGLKMSSISYTVNLTPHSTTEADTQERQNLAINSLILFTNIAYRITIFMTFFMMLLAVTFGVYALVIFLGQNKPIEGWTTTMLFLSVCFSGLFLSAGVIIKYLSLLVDISFKKQNYTIESIEKLT